MCERPHDGQTPAPWSTDRDLTLDAVTAEITRQFPDLRPVRARHVGSGWDYDAYRVNREWVFRFPRRCDVDQMLDREMAVLARLPRLSGVLTPVAEKVGRPGSGFPYRFVGHRWTPGLGADEFPEDRLNRTAFARQLGAALSDLHGADATAQIAIGIPEEQEGPRQWLDEVVRTAAVIRSGLPADMLERCKPYLVGEVDVPPAYAGPLRLIHNDIGLEHLILDQDSGRLVGIIDWEDTSMGDPACDFVALRCWLGSAFVEEILKQYAIELDDGFRDRLEFFARVHSLDRLGKTLVREGSERVDRHVAWVRRAFLTR